MPPFFSPPRSDKSSPLVSVLHRSQGIPSFSRRLGSMQLFPPLRRKDCLFPVRNTRFAIPPLAAFPLGRKVLPSFTSPSVSITAKGLGLPPPPSIEDREAGDLGSPASRFPSLARVPFLFFSFSAEVGADPRLMSQQ